MIFEQYLNDEATAQINLRREAAVTIKRIRALSIKIRHQIVPPEMLEVWRTVVDPITTLLLRKINTADGDITSTMVGYYQSVLKHLSSEINTWDRGQTEVLGTMLTDLMSYMSNLLVIVGKSRGRLLTVTEVLSLCSLSRTLFDKFPPYTLEFTPALVITYDDRISYREDRSHLFLVHHHLPTGFVVEYQFGPRGAFENDSGDLVTIVVPAEDYRPEASFNRVVVKNVSFQDGKLLAMANHGYIHANSVEITDITIHFIDGIPEYMTARVVDHNQDAITIPAGNSCLVRDPRSSRDSFEISSVQKQISKIRDDQQVLHLVDRITTDDPLLVPLSQVRANVVNIEAVADGRVYCTFDREVVVPESMRLGMRALVKYNQPPWKELTSVICIDMYPCDVRTLY